MKNVIFRSSVLSLCLFFSLIPVLLAESSQDAVTHVTIGEAQLPIVAETASLNIIKMGPHFIRIKKATEDGEISKYKDCRIYDAQQTILTKEPKKMVQIYEECLEKTPNDPVVLQAIGIAAMVSRDFGKSADYLGKASRARPEDALLLEQLGDAYVMQGSMDKARQSYALAIQKMSRKEASRLTRKREEIEGFGFDNVAKSYLLDFAGVRFSDGFAIALLYPEDARNQEVKGQRHIYYESKTEEGKEGIIVPEKLYPQLSVMRELEGFIKKDRAPFDKTNKSEEADLKKKQIEIKRAKKEEKTALEDELQQARQQFIRRVVSQESLYLALRERIKDDLEKEMERAAQQIARSNGYSLILEAKKGTALPDVDVTNLVIPLINEHYAPGGNDFKKIMEASKPEVQIRDTIDVDEFFSDQPKLAAIDKKPDLSKDAEADQGTKTPASAKKKGESESEKASFGEGEAPLTPGSHNITDYGLASAIKKNMIEWSAVGRRNVFRTDDARIIWFARLSNYGKIKDAWSQGKYTVEWLAPDGETYLKETVKQGSFHQDLVYSTLELSKFPSVPSGKWRVKVWRKKDLINDQYFTVQQAEQNG